MACDNGNTLCNSRDLCTACRASRPTIAPLVHLNGSSADFLMSTLTDAANALTAVLRALSDAAPNMRDYYPLGEEAWRAARTQYEADMAALRDMRARYTVALEHVQEQIDEREARRG